MEEWRIFLYPLGYLSAFTFGARFIVQWLQSEKAGLSLAPRSFWELSLLGNLLLMLHTFIQVQYPICAIQACHAVISWRNLNLLQTKKAPISFTTTCFLLIASIFCISLAFTIQGLLTSAKSDWFRIPIAPWQSSLTPSLPLFWHLIGAFAYFLFSSRFWVQWWFAEKTLKSQLPLSFWWISLMGAFLSILYFLRIGDSVNLIGPLIGIIPYARNLILIRKRQRELARGLMK